MKNATLLFLFFFPAVLSIAQAPAIQWSKSLGTDIFSAEASCIQQTADGGYIAAGAASATGDQIGYYRCLIVKTNNLGVQQWQKLYGGPGWAVSIQQISNGGYIMAGLSPEGLPGNHGANDFWIMELNASGDSIWQKSLGGPKDEHPVDAQQTYDGGFVIAGTFYDYTDGDESQQHYNRDMLIYKLDENGGLEWEKKLGGILQEGCESIQQTLDSGYILAGYRYDFNDYTTSDYLVIELRKDGSVQWEKTLGGSKQDQAYCIRQCTDTGYTVIGFSRSNDGQVSGNHGGSDGWVVKLDTTGNIQWQKSIGGSADERLTKLSLTREGGYILAGDYDGLGHLLKLNKSGNLQWEQDVGGTFSWERPASINITADNGYILASTLRVSLDFRGFIATKFSPDKYTNLPLTLLGFTAIRQQDAALLQWHTTAEIQTSHFFVQRSVDGIHFSTISRVNAAGNTASKQYYQYVDPSIPSAVCYYRLVCVDSDGKQTISRIIAFTNTTIGKPLSLSPNPAKGIVQLRMKGIQHISIADISGRLVLSRKEDGSDIVTIDISRLVAGHYIVTATEQGGKLHSGKLEVR